MEISKKDLLILCDRKFTETSQLLGEAVNAHHFAEERLGLADGYSYPPNYAATSKIADLKKRHKKLSAHVAEVTRMHDMLLKQSSALAITVSFESGDKEKVASVASEFLMNANQLDDISTDLENEVLELIAKTEAISAVAHKYNA